jgi:hypothetical protein
MTRDGRNEGPVGQAGGHSPDSLLDRQLDALLEQLEIEKAPASLTRRLHRIPHEAGASPAWWRRLLAPGQAPRWALVPALAAVLLVIGVIMTQPRQPSQQEILQARHDLAVAFGYIDRAGVLTGQEIRSILGGELRHSVKDNLSKGIPFTEQFRKEETT